MYASVEKTLFDKKKNPNDKGYSVYFYTPDISSKYCVLHNEDSYRFQWYLLNFGFLIIVVFAI